MPLYFFKPVVWNEKGYLRPQEELSSPLGILPSTGLAMKSGITLTDWSILKMVNVGEFFIHNHLETSRFQLTRGKYSFL
jgi:hypothetical protein